MRPAGYASAATSNILPVVLLELTKLVPTMPLGFIKTAQEPLPQAPLMPFDATGRTPWAVPFGLQEYVELVEWTGRLVHPAKRGSIAENEPPILERIGVDGEAFIAMAASFLKEFGSAVGAPARLTDLCAQRQTRFLHGMRAARKVFGRRERLTA